MKPKVYMIDKRLDLKSEFTPHEVEYFSQNLIVDVDLHPGVGSDVLSDWIMDIGHEGGYNNRSSHRAWWLSRSDLVEVSKGRI